MIGSSAELRGERRERLAGFVAADQRARTSSAKSREFDERLAQRIEAAADRIDLPLVAGKVEQSGRVAPC